MAMKWSLLVLSDNKVAPSAGNLFIHILLLQVSLSSFTSCQEHLILVLVPVLAFESGPEIVSPLFHPSQKLGSNFQKSFKK